ncbi:MAG: hypothetical protein KDA78_06220 [Planctomycetaceae bacterium]|nr:hypothetical protein [Planctomycetaceae bacterium]
MSYRHFSLQAGSAFCSLICLTLFLAGCSESGKITTYETLKPDAVREANHVDDGPRPERTAPPAMATSSTPVGEPSRMFAAIVPQGDQFWFFKMTGPVEDVGTLSAPLADFVKSIQFVNDKPEWTLPEGWTEQPGNQFRYATLVVPGASGPLEFSVSPLPNSGEERIQVTANINRWRGQLGLADLASESLDQLTDDIAQETSLVKAGDQNIYFVNIVGKSQATGMRPPFAN